MLDSSFLVRFGRGSRLETEWLQGHSNSTDVIGHCAVVVAEIYAGAHPAEREGWRELFGALTAWPTLLEDAVTSGIWRYDLARQGFQIHLGDALIAAVARRVGATVVTHNVRDFARIGVAVETVAQS